MEKPRRSFWQIWNMSFGFLGIQFGWGLQMANLSPIYAKLGAEADKIPMLWLAAPMTGLIVQPSIGSMRDRTWGRLGRRRPYFLVGAAGLVSVWFIRDQNLLLRTMVGVGIAWASILSMPYAILSGALPPQRLGVYMGIFNFFIVIPEITAALTFRPLVKHVFHNNEAAVVVRGGVLLAVAALLVQPVRDVGAETIQQEHAVFEADAQAAFTLPEAVQPAPSTGMEPVRKMKSGD